MPCGQRTGGVGQILPLAGDGRLDQCCQQRGQDHGGQAHHKNQRVSAAALAAHSPKKGHACEHIGHNAHHHNQTKHNGGHSNVEVFDVRNFVGHHALQLSVIHDLQQTGGCRDRRVLRVTPGGKSIRSWIIDDVDLRHRQPGGDRKIFDNAIEPGVVRFLDLDCPRHGQRLGPGRVVLDGHINQCANKHTKEHDTGAIAGHGKICQVAEACHQDHEERQDEPGVAFIRRYRPIHGCLRLGSKT